jgi:hypothetical protein
MVFGPVSARPSSQVSINCPSICGRACRPRTAGMSPAGEADAAPRRPKRLNGRHLGAGWQTPSRRATRGGAEGSGGIAESEPARTRRSRDLAARPRRLTPENAGTGQGEHAGSVRRAPEPTPLGFHSEALGDFVSCEQPVHDLSPNEFSQRAAAGGSYLARWIDDERPVCVYMMEIPEVAVRAKYCVGTVGSRVDEDGRAQPFRPDRPAGMGTSWCGAIPSSHTADASRNLDSSAGRRLT